MTETQALAVPTATTLGKTLSQSTLQLQKQYFFDVRQLSKSVSSITYYFIKSFSDLCASGIHGNLKSGDAAAARVKIKLMLSRISEQLSSEGDTGEPITFKLIKSKFKDLYQDFSVSPAEKQIFDAIVSDDNPSMYFIGNPEEKVEPLREDDTARKNDNAPNILAAFFNENLAKLTQLFQKNIFNDIKGKIQSVFRNISTSSINIEQIKTALADTLNGLPETKFPGNNKEIIIKFTQIFIDGYIRNKGIEALNPNELRDFIIKEFNILLNVIKKERKLFNRFESSFIEEISKKSDRLSDEAIHSVLQSLISKLLDKEPQESNYEETKSKILEYLKVLYSENRENIEKLVRYSDLSLDHSLEHAVFQYLDKTTGEIPPSGTLYFSTPAKDKAKDNPLETITADEISRLKTKIFAILPAITSGKYEFAPITFSKIVFRLTEKDVMPEAKTGDNTLTEKEIRFLRFLEEKNRKEFLEKAKTQARLHSKEFLDSINLESLRNRTSDGNVSNTALEESKRIITVLKDFSIVGVSPVLSTEADGEVLFNCIDIIKGIYIESINTAHNIEEKTTRQDKSKKKTEDKGMLNKIPELIDILVKNFMYDYRLEPEEETLLTEERREAHKKIIPIIAELVNTYLEQQEQIEDPSFVRNLVFLTDSCRLLATNEEFQESKSNGQILTKINPEHICYRKFINKIQIKETEISKKTREDISLSSDYQAIEEYTMFLDPRIGYRQSAEGNREIYSVAAITGFCMDVDLMFTAKDEIFGYMIEIEGPSHYLYGNGEVADILHPQTMIRDRIRDSITKLELEATRVREVRFELKERLKKLKSDVKNLKIFLEELEKAKKKLQEIRKSFDGYSPAKYYETKLPEIHFNPCLRVYSGSREKTSQTGYIQSLLHSVSQPSKTMLAKLVAEKSEPYQSEGLTAYQAQSPETPSSTPNFARNERLRSTKTKAEVHEMEF